MRTGVAIALTALASLRGNASVTDTLDRASRTSETRLRDPNQACFTWCMPWQTQSSSLWSGAGERKPRAADASAAVATLFHACEAPQNIREPGNSIGLIVAMPASSDTSVPVAVSDR